MRALLVAVLLCTAGPALAQQQTPQPRQQQRPCVPPPHPLFEFQVERPPAFLTEVGLGVRPVRDPVRAYETGGDTVLVQFVVDTLGVPLPATFKVLKATRPEQAAQARAALPRWRFAPATLGGCKVPQLVQTALEWITPPTRQG